MPIVKSGEPYTGNSIYGKNQLLRVSRVLIAISNHKARVGNQLPTAWRVGICDRYPLDYG